METNHRKAIPGAGWGMLECLTEAREQSINSHVVLDELLVAELFWIGRCKGNVLDDTCHSLTEACLVHVDCDNCLFHFFYFYLFVNIFDERISLQLLHRLKINHLWSIITEVLVCNNPIFIFFYHAVALIREVKKPIPTLKNLVYVVSQRQEGSLQIAWLRVYGRRIRNLTTCNLVKYLTVDLEHWADLPGDEELKAGTESM